MAYQFTSDGPPNLDCMADSDEVWEFAESVKPRPRIAARLMFPSRPKGYVSATISLMHYAYNKATAMRCRVRGDMQAAQNYESICDSIYSRLPDFAKTW